LREQERQPGAQKPNAMARTLPTLHETDLEAALLRKSVGSLTATRSLCEDCGRTPLVGEHLYRYGRSSVCALCTRRRRTEPDAVELVRHFERGQTVKIVASRAA
jgi:hypothetical protein